MYMSPTYGPYQWALPPMAYPIISIPSYSILGEDISPSRDKLKTLGFRPVDEVYRWFLRYLVDGQITPIVGTSSTSTTWRQLIYQHTILPSTSIISTLPPAPKYRELLYSVLSVLVSNRIYNQHALALYLQSFLCNNNNTNKNGNVTTNKIPLIQSLRGLVATEYQSIYDQYWISLCKL